ncbi:farnesol dehydrogenase-like [Agrilus planipennis]|uniref:Farnesol dehydrogenase-like n=1 Tax=Agrilus planipennis TaxID=224129 RepID=A0A7F5R083_AGRPL|nr:farnesol dehydrogenase-like [Agrilus planipennis]
MKRWDGKVAVITGANSGIGAAIVEDLVNLGLKVVGLARRKEKLEELARTLDGKEGKFYPFQADVTQEESVVKAFQWATENVGPVSILVNSAGLGKPINLTEGKIEDFRKILDTNVLGICIATKEAVQIMKKNNIDGHVININSVVGHMVPPIAHYNVYPASKYAVTALTETLRHELRDLNTKIKVTSISPGLVDTPIFEVNGYNYDNAPILKIAPRLQAKDVSDAVLYVLGTPPNVQVTELTIKPLGELI